jgi:pimeloyl-ACP methyl ester carboxylesterase
MENPWTRIPKVAGAKVESKMVGMDDGWSIRVIQWVPENDSDSAPLVMVPGWNSVYEGWQDIVEEWAPKRRLTYIETREKGSAVSTGRAKKSDLSIRRSVEDLKTVISEFPEISSGSDWFASSLGATIILEALAERAFKPRSVALLAPNTSFDFPLWSRLLIMLPSFVYPPLVRLAILILDFKLKEEGQRIRYRRTLLASNVKRLRLSAMSQFAYKMKDEVISSIQDRIALLTAKSDSLHSDDAVVLLSERLPNSQLIEVPSNQFAHDAEVIPILEVFQDDN